MKKLLAVSLLLLTGLAASAQHLTSQPASAQYCPTPENLAARAQFDNDRFGIFIHCGIYSMLGQGEWVMQNKDIHYDEYSHLAAGFCPSKFDAVQWVRAIKASGAKYITITTRHHDGFAMFDSKASDYNIVDATPFGRDVIAELADACRQEGIRLHLYYSHLDWGRDDYYPLGRTGLGTGRPDLSAEANAAAGTSAGTAAGRDFDAGSAWKHYQDFMDAQLTELLTGYGPIGAIWFDGVWDKDAFSREKQDSIWGLTHQYELIHRLQPACLVGNNHHFLPLEGEDIQIFERDIPGQNTYGLSGQEISRLPLETCQTMNHSWGYRVTDRDYKSSDDLIRYLVSTAGKGANLLLNIGPRPDGTLPDEALERLEAMGKWLEINGESIYGTTAGLLPEAEWGVSTQKGNVLYIHILDAAKAGENIVFETGNRLVSASVLGQPYASAIASQKKSVVTVKVPCEAAGPDTIIRLEFKKALDDYVDWLYDYMPLPDSLTYDRAYWEANVAKTLEVRENAAWTVPEREFLHFVLPLRVNNETLDDFRTLYADTLCSRVRGMSLYDAALEVNHWCHEQATYHPSDGRTSSPTATMRNGLGRCGEESVLAVAALRAAGIPARQVYTPRWAHTDDNHAWVEVWVDGKWYFMGACEPAPTLNNAWFNAPVSRAMLLHTKVFGKYEGPEDVIYKTPISTEINVIEGYVPARRTSVTVVDTDGRPVADAVVGFKIYNYAEFYTVCWYRTDKNGRTALNTGCGDVFLWCYDGDRFGFGVASSEETTVVLDHVFGEEFSADVNIVPPVENPIPSDAGEEAEALNVRRLAQEDSIRATHAHDNPAVAAFLASRMRGSEELLSQLSRKDHCDVSLEVLYDALENSSSLDPYILSPRVANEFLLPHRAEILASGIGKRIHSVEEALSWTRDSIRIVNDRNPQRLATSPIAVWRSRMADERGRNIFFVAFVRTLGFAARIDEVTGKTQYRWGKVWIDADLDAAGNTTTAAAGTTAATTGTTAHYDLGPAAAPEGRLRLTSESRRTPMYYRHFSISDISGHKDNLLEFGADSDETPITEFAEGVSVPAGYYMLTSGTRMADGSVLAHIEFFNVRDGAETTVPVVLRQSDTDLSVIGSMDAEQLFLREGETEQQSILSATGRGYFVLAVLGEKDEPSMHARLDLRSAEAAIEAWGRPVVILGNGGKPLRSAVYGTDVDGKVMKMLCDGCESMSPILPVVAVCDSFGRIVYFSQGYNTSLGSDLQAVIEKL